MKKSFRHSWAFTRISLWEEGGMGGRRKAAVVGGGRLHLSFPS